MSRSPDDSDDEMSVDEDEVLIRGPFGPEMVGELAVHDGQLVHLHDYDDETDTWYVKVLLPWRTGPVVLAPGVELRDLTAAERHAVRLSNTINIGVHEDVPLGKGVSRAPPRGRSGWGQIRSTYCAYEAQTVLANLQP